MNFTQLNFYFFFKKKDVKQQLQIVQDIKDNIDIVDVVQTGRYPSYLKFLFPIFYNLLRQGAVQEVDGPQQKIRTMILEILNRLPNDENLKPSAHNLLKLSMFLLEVENEDNAVICLR